MPIDASIPLQVKQFHVPTAQEMMSLQDLSTRNQLNQTSLQEKQLELGKRNALQDLAQQPGMVGPDGSPTAAYIAGAMRIDPTVGAGLAKDAITLQTLRNQMDTKVTDAKRSTGEAALQTFQDALKRGMDKDAAWTYARGETLKNIDANIASGSYSGIPEQARQRLRQLPDTVEALMSHQRSIGGKVPEPDETPFAKELRAAGYKPGTPEYEKAMRAKVAKDTAPPQTLIRMEADKLGDYTKTGDEFLNTLPAQHRAMVKKIANYEMDPKTFSTIGGQRERALGWAAQYDPNFDQKEYNSRYQAVNKFNTGPQGNIVRSLNVAIQHMDTARKLGDALKNNDTQLFNKVAQTFAEQTGKPAPTNFEAVKDILADEVVKGVLGSAGGVEDRQKMASKIKLASSPEQLHGALNSWTELLSGQVEGLRTQYEASTGRKDFDTKLNPRTREAISAAKGGAKGNTGSAWVERAMKANPNMSREEVEAEAKKRGKL